MPPRHRLCIDGGEMAGIRLARSLAGALNLPCLFLDVRNDRHTAQSVLRLVGRVDSSPRAVPEHRHNRRLPLRDLCQGDGPGISFRTCQDFARIHNSQLHGSVVCPAGRSTRRPVRSAKGATSIHRPPGFDPGFQQGFVRGDMATLRLLFGFGFSLRRRRSDVVHRRGLSLV